MIQTHSNHEAEEIWARIEGFEGVRCYYEVSSLGRVRSVPYDSFKNSHRGRVMQQRLNKKGYLTVNIYSGRKQKNLRVHRAVATAFIPNPDNKPEVNHKWGIKQDNRVESLEWSTSSWNKQHAWDHGLYPRRRPGMRKEPHYAQQVLAMKASGMRNGKISKELNIKTRTLERCIHNMRYNKYSAQCASIININPQKPNKMRTDST